MLPTHAALPDSYDALDAFAHRLARLPMRSDWRYIEPDALDLIREESEAWDDASPARVDPVRIAPRVEAAFLASVCGCILGKPLEVATDLAAIRAAAERANEWPLTDYVSEDLLRALGKRHGDPR